MNAASTFSTVNLTTGDLTDDQIAYITANRSKLSGISIATDWDRQTSTGSLSTLLVQFLQNNQVCQLKKQKNI